MDAGDLRFFEAVARLGGMNRAANELNTVQSNVTTRIRLMEERLGMPLFRRHVRGVALTPAGQRLLPYSIKIARLLDEAKRAVEDDGTPKGPLSIGSLETTAARRLPEIISLFCGRHPSVNLSLKTGTNATLFDQVIGYELDGAFVCGPIDHPDLDSWQIFTEELVIATAPGRQPFERHAASGEVKILVKGCGCAYRERYEQLLSAKGIPFSRLEFGTLDAIIGCVSAGIGETLLPRSVLERAAKGDVVLHALPGPDAYTETVFIRRRDVAASSALQAFLDLLLSSTRVTEAAE
ncbi:DNA-binding transcriptional LysR family regulator [Bradyrhizobium sp. USDA 4461]